MYLNIDDITNSEIEKTRKELNKNLLITVGKADYYQLCFRFASKYLLSDRIKKEEIAQLIIKQ
jgi:hypothetical protein